MRVMLSYLLVTVCVFQIVHAQQATGLKKPTFSVTISGPRQPFKTGSAMLVNIELRNVSGSKISFFRMNDGEAGPYEYVPRVHDEEDEMAPRTVHGRNVIDHIPGVSVGHPFPANVDINDGDAVRQTIDLTKYYDLSKPGNYTVQLERREGDATIRSNIIAITIE
jgi:hypothetical protein